MAEATALESRCANCGAPFTCGMKTGKAPCWCTELPPLEPEPGQSCLCRVCLEQALADKPPG